MPRLFTGLEIPADVAQRLSMLRGGLFGARWIEPEDYHVTLRFIGDIDGRTADDIAHALGAVRRRPLTLELSGLDVFGRDKPHSLHALVKPSRALEELAGEHERLMRRFGLAPETRRFIPHVTVARLKGVDARTMADWIAMRSPVSTGPFTVGRFALFSSKDSVGGGPYLVEETYPLVA